MLLGILQTGHVNPKLVGRHGEYPPMFERLLGAADPDIAYRTYDVVSGVLPGDIEECDAWLVTGSRFGVYDPEPWIPRLRDFLRQAYEAGRPIVGICFGHQLLAEALGGEVIKSPKGWGAGVHRYRAHASPAWAGAIDEGALSVHSMHQDQVVRLPDQAHVIAESEFCPFAALAYGDEAEPTAISIQPHPEFAADFEKDLVTLRRGDPIPEPVADDALASLGAPVDNASVARWITAFLRRAAARQRDA